MQAGQRNFGGRHQPQVLLVIVVQVVVELGQLAGGEERLAAHQERRVLLPVALAGVQVEHPGDQRPLQARPAPLRT